MRRTEYKINTCPKQLNFKKEHAKHTKVRDKAREVEGKVHDDQDIGVGLR